VTHRILIVEDEPKTRETTRLYLEREGFEVASAEDGLVALRKAREHPPDLVVLDLMLPGLNGYDVCRALRRERGIPIIMLTARSTEDDKLLGLDLGADDYVTKPFSPRELVARVRAVLRRTDGDVRPTVVRHGELTIDRDRHLVEVSGTRVPLTPSEEGILATLAGNPSRVYSRAELIEKALGGGGEVLDRTVDAHVTNLRKKLRAAGATDLVVTVFGFGYRLSEESSE